MYCFFVIFEVLQRSNDQTNTTIMKSFKQPKSLQQSIVSGATRRAQLARSIARKLGLDGHDINNKRVIVDSFKGDCAICIIDFDFNNKVAIRIR